MDANALMMPVEADVRVFEELDRVTADLDVADTTPADADRADYGTAESDRADYGTAESDRADYGTAESDRADDATTDASDPRYAVPQAVIAELERLADGAGEAATAASVGLDLARERCRVLDHEAESGDAAVLECARRPDVSHVVTNDRALRADLLDAGVPVLSLRASNKLAVTQP